MPAFFEHTSLRTGLNFGEQILEALVEESMLAGETPPSELDLLLARAGLKGPLDLTPLPGATPSHSTQPPTPSNEPLLSDDSSDVAPSGAIPTERLLEEVSLRLSARAPFGPPTSVNGRRSPPAQQPSYREKKKLLRRHRRGKGRAERKKEQLATSCSAFDYKVHPHLSRKFKVTRILPCAINTEDLPACKGAWIGKRNTEKKRCLTLEEAQAMGLRLVEWDGM